MKMLIIGITIGLFVGVAIKKLGQFIKRKTFVDYLGDDFAIDPTDWIGQI